MYVLACHCTALNECSVVQCSVMKTDMIEIDQIVQATSTLVVAITVVVVVIVVVVVAPSQAVHALNHLYYQGIHEGPAMVGP